MLTHIISNEVLKYCYHNNKTRIERISPNATLTKEDVQQIQKDYSDGKLTILELAKKYGVARSTIEHYLPKIRKNRRLPNNTKESTEKEELISRVIQMYESGSSVKDIKDILKVNFVEIRNILISYMEIKNNKLSKKSLEILQKLGYDVTLIKKVAQNRKIQIEKSEQEEIEK